MQGKNVQEREKFSLFIINMKEGLGNAQTCAQQHPTDSDYVFSLKRLTQQGPTVGIQVDFAALQPANETGGFCPPRPNLPVFNRDGRHYTPCFFLSSDQIKFESNMEVCLANHLRKVKEMSEEKNQLFVPKPSETNRFCMVCRQQFDDYLTHIANPAHKAQLRQSSFHADILELCKARTPLTAPVSHKKIRKERTKKPERAKLHGMERRKSQESASTGVVQQTQLLVDCQ